MRIREEPPNTGDGRPGSSPSCWPRWEVGVRGVASIPSPPPHASSRKPWHQCDHGTHRGAGGYETHTHIRTHTLGDLVHTPPLERTCAMTGMSTGDRRGNKLATRGRGWAPDEPWWDEPDEPQPAPNPTKRSTKKRKKKGKGKKGNAKKGTCKTKQNEQFNVPGAVRCKCSA